MSPAVHEALRNKNLGSWELDLPCPPEFQAAHNTSSWHLELTRFFAHPETVTVGITTDRGHEEMDYVPQLQSFRVAIDGQAVGSLTLMADHVVGSFHQHGRQYDVMHKAGTRYVLADMNQLRHHEPLNVGWSTPTSCLPFQTANSGLRPQGWMAGAWKSHLIWISSLGPPSTTWTTPRNGRLR